MGCSPWGREEADTTERLHFHFSLSCIGEGNGNPLQCSCLENPRDGGAWWVAVYGVAQSRTRLKQLSSSSSLDKQSYKGLIDKHMHPQILLISYLAVYAQPHLFNEFIVSCQININFLIPLTSLKGMNFINGTETEKKYNIRKSKLLDLTVTSVEIK